MRKWILEMLFGSDAGSWNDMFKIALECHESCKKLLKSNEFMLERYKEISSKNIALLNAIAAATNIHSLQKEVAFMLRDWEEERKNTEVFKVEKDEEVQG